MLLSPERCSVAWFKLSELVFRREKERALTIFRLMVHSWNDEAYALQLKGDLLCAFHDYDRAQESYVGAIQLYESSDRPIQAMLVCEQLVLLNTQPGIRQELISRCAALNYKPQVKRHMYALLLTSIQQNTIDENLLFLTDIATQYKNPMMHQSLEWAISTLISQHLIEQSINIAPLIHELKQSHNHLYTMAHRELHPEKTISL